jgi:hypothetical protein
MLKILRLIIILGMEPNQPCQYLSDSHPTLSQNCNPVEKTAWPKVGYHPPLRGPESSHLDSMTELPHNYWPYWSVTIGQYRYWYLNCTTVSIFTGNAYTGANLIVFEHDKNALNDICMQGI